MDRKKIEEYVLTRVFAQDPRGNCTRWYMLDMHNLGSGFYAQLIDDAPMQTTWLHLYRAIDNHTFPNVIRIKTYALAMLDVVTVVNKELHIM